MRRVINAQARSSGAVARRCAAAAWLWFGGVMAASGAVPAVPPDDNLAPLVAAFNRVAQPGEKANTYRELIGSVARRVERGFALPVDLAAFAEAKQKEDSENKKRQEEIEKAREQM